MSSARNRRRVAFVLGSMHRGGAERVVSYLANHYAATGWQVDIITLLFSGCDYSLHPDVRVISLASEGRTRWFQLPAWITGLRRYMQIARPQTVVAFAARINIIVALAGWGCKHRLIVSERNDPAADGRSRLVRWLTERIYRRVARVVFQTKWAQSCFSSQVQANSVVISNPVDTDVVPVDSSLPVIVTAGRLEPQKNHRLLLHAFAAMNQVRPGYHLQIFGEGPLRDELRLCAHGLGLDDVVELPGTVSEIHERMAAARMFVLSSDYEGLSNALLEAMQIGVASVSTACAGSSEVVVDHINGLLVPVGDATALSEAMLSLANDEELRRRLAVAARETGKGFRPLRIFAQWDDIVDPEVARRTVN